MTPSTQAIDPEFAAAQILLQEKGLVAPDRTVSPLREVRAAQDRIGAFLCEGSAPLAGERDLGVAGPHGAIPCRLYPAEGSAQPPLLVYAHGGGFVQGSLPGWDGYLRALVRASGVAALSVDYRLSPEHKFPVAFEEMVAVIRFAAGEGAGLGIDPRRLAAGGDSAGANLALAAALALRDADERALSFLLLVYGVYSTDSESPSWRRFGQGTGLSQAQMRWILETYLTKSAEREDWRVAPLLAPLAGLPRVHLIVGDRDPLLDDSERLAEKLAAAGVSHAVSVYPGLGHGFIRYGRFVATVRRAVEECAAALRQGLAPG